MESAKENLYCNVDEIRGYLGIPFDCPIDVPELLLAYPDRYIISFIPFKTPGLCGIAMVGNKSDTNAWLPQILAEHYYVTSQVISNRINNLSYEIDQYRNGTPIESIQLLSRNQQQRMGIHPTCGWSQYVQKGVCY